MHQLTYANTLVYISGATTHDGIESVSPFVSGTLVAACETLKLGGVTPRYASAVERFV